MSDESQDGTAIARKEERMPCPHCGEQILAVAKKCRFCGEWLSGSKSPAEAVEEFSDYAGPGASPGRSGALFKKEPWTLRPDEVVITRSQPYPRRVLIFLLIAALPTLGITAVAAGCVWLYYRLMRFEWILTDRRLISVGGWLRREAHNTSLDKINEVNYTRGFWDRVLWGTGAITVESAATAGATVLDTAADDDPFRHALEAQIEKRRRELRGA